MVKVSRDIREELRSVLMADKALLLWRMGLVQRSPLARSMAFPAGGIRRNALVKIVCRDERRLFVYRKEKEYEQYCCGKSKKRDILSHGMSLLKIVVTDWKTRLPRRSAPRNDSTRDFLPNHVTCITIRTENNNCPQPCLPFLSDFANSAKATTEYSSGFSRGPSNAAKPALFSKRSS